MDSLDQLKFRALRIGALVAIILTIGTIGYRLVSHGESSWIDCLYMVVITVATIGYEEVVPLEHHPAGRIFTMFVALFGIGIITYVMGTVTQIAVDGDLQKRWRRRKMQQEIQKLDGHYIVCGWSELAPQIMSELQQTQRPFVLVAPTRSEVERDLGEAMPSLLVEGDPTDDEVLRRAGIARAAGVFAADVEDQANIVICMSARSLRPEARIVAMVRDSRNAAKMRKAGATAVVSPVTIGAMRMSSEMLRPSVVSFLDVMLRDQDKKLRIEDVPVGAARSGQTLAALQLDRYDHTVLLALRRGEEWVFKPKPDHTVASGDILVIMTNPDERQRLAAALA